LSSLFPRSAKWGPCLLSWYSTSMKRTTDSWAVATYIATCCRCWTRPLSSFYHSRTLHLRAKSSSVDKAGTVDDERLVFLRLPFLDNLVAAKVRLYVRHERDGICVHVLLFEHGEGRRLRNVVGKKVQLAIGSTKERIGPQDQDDFSFLFFFEYWTIDAPGWCQKVVYGEADRMACELSQTRCST
jgi:hypothetical protein